MKKLFSGFYSPTDNEIKASWSNEKTLFVFDTNVLLNLYGYTKITREDFFKIVEKVTDNIWLPYHVGLEYQRRRLNVVKNEKGIFNNIEKYVKSIEKQINNSEFDKLKLKQRLPDLFDSSKELHTKIEELLSEYRDSVKEWNNQQPDVRSSDLIRKTIDELFDDKVGNPFKQVILDKIYKEGKERYDNKIPPGFEDKKEKEKADKFTYQGLIYIPMYGDLIIWKQIIEKAKDDNIESVIFVTDDLKKDWWYTLDSNGKKEIGVRAELREEIYRESGISSFEILTTTSFMKNGKEFLELEEVHEESIAEAKTNINNYRRRIMNSESVHQLTEEYGLPKPHLNNDLLNLSTLRKDRILEYYNDLRDSLTQNNYESDLSKTIKYLNELGTNSEKQEVYEYMKKLGLDSKEQEEKYREVCELMNRFDK